MSTFSSLNPATGETVWTGACTSADGVAAAVERATAAGRTWSRLAPAAREASLRAFARVLEARRSRVAEAISREVGKPAWEAASEVTSMIGKVELSITAQARRTAEFVGGPAVTRFRPHGVVAVFGPFNFPGHLPNGHIVPALLAGNTVVFKPSEYAPWVAEHYAACWREAGLPPGVLEVVPGGRETGAALVDDPGLNGLFFTGSARTGLWLAERFARTPEKILALELGGNNPLVVWPPRDLTAAALLVVQSAYLTAGQRCTCARRLIVPGGAAGDAFLAELIRAMGTIRVGPFTQVPEPFMGPVISAAAAGQVIAAQEDLVARGASVLVAVRSLRLGTGLVSPGLIDVTSVRERRDEEIFGPLLQVIRVPDFAAALAEANATRYGLAAGLIADDAALYARFRDEVRAGIVNWNQPLTGASGAAPFGGVGQSGNHRPSGFFAADYCAYPVASIEVPELIRPASLPPGLNP
ncbi:MAG: succinylglutamate-semialdehyde dehydrogenase [Opitutaceae bacterium]